MTSPFRVSSFAELYILLRDTIYAHIEDEMLSRGASISFYAATALAPLLFICVAIAGLVFGQDAARGVIAHELQGLVGRASADIVENAIRNASGTSKTTLANIGGFVMLLVVASGVFGEMQVALNTIWKMPTKRTWYWSLIVARARSLGLVIALGFLLLTAMVVTAIATAISNYIDTRAGMATILLRGMNFLISFGLTTLMFAAIYKVLPDRRLAWRDVWLGAIGSALLFQIGQLLIGLYLGSTAIESVYGAAGGLIVLLLWIYYSAQTFLLGAEFTKIYASRRGSQRPNKERLTPTRSK